MNTAIFNILLVLFCLLYILHFSFWFRLKKFAPFKNSPQSRLYTFLAPAIVAVCVIVIGVLFIMDSGVKFRLSLMIILTAPILITHLGATTKHCRLVRVTSIFLYLIIIPMTIIYCL
jgi:hypothetical protein